MLCNAYDDMSNFSARSKHQRCDNIPLDLIIEAIRWGSLSLVDAFDVPLGGTCHETFTRGVMAPPARVRAGGDSDSPTRRSWKDSTTYSVIPTNSSFVGDGCIRCATRWPTVPAALRRPNGNAAKVPRVRCFGESGSPPTSYIMSLAKEKVR